MSAYTGKIGNGYIIISTFASMGIILLILCVLFFNSFAAIRDVGWSLFTLTWNPPHAQFGILPMFYGSLAVTVISLVIAVPLGIFTAIFTSEILHPGYRFSVKAFLELLAGIPSIIYGLIGVAFFSVWVGELFHLQSGRTIFTAAVLLSIMILPTIITLCDDAIHRVPQKYREAAKGLGLCKHEVIISSVLPIAKPDIIGAVVLALGRALGETMAVMLVIGSIDKIPAPFYNLLAPGQTITSKLGREITGSAFGSLHFSAMIFMGIMLLVIVLALTLIAQYFSKSGQRLYE
ncbi:MAG: phosphate ABC transporter permease subunit PstC [Candidatus Brocadiaceae bacterium]|nr:phosphate ABC transporter permease subunit PstC [Candidatus Brocadiaceae bacterium]